MADGGGTTHLASGASQLSAVRNNRKKKKGRPPTSVCPHGVDGDQTTTRTRHAVHINHMRDSNREREHRLVPTAVDQHDPHLDEGSGLGAFLERRAQLVRQKCHGRVGGLDVLLDRLQR